MEIGTKWNLTFVASFRAFDGAESQGMVVDFVLCVRILAQISVWAVLYSYRRDISVATTGYGQVSKLSFRIKNWSSNFVIGMCKPALVNTSACLIADCRAGLYCEHVLVDLNRWADFGVNRNDKVEHLKRLCIL